MLWAGVGAAAIRRSRRSVAANDKVILGAIGLGGRGSGLVRRFATRPDIEFAYLCDLDPRRGTNVPDTLGDAQERPARRVADYQQVLDDPDVDAVIIATPDHWHGPLTVYACQAGKDVYVEKPPSHNVWEGRKMVEAARRYDRVVQVGTQNRSAPYVRKALEYIRGGALGTIHLCKVFNLKSGGPYSEPPDSDPPPGVDYDRWLGPAPMRPFNEGHFHRGWKKYWAYSGGDAADDGVHQLDIARWLIGRDYPTAISATGGNLAFDDDREVPDTQVVAYDFDDLVMTFELTQWAPYMKKTLGRIRETDEFPYWPQNSTRIELYGTKNLMIMGRHGGGWQAFTGEGEVVAREYGHNPNDAHQENFINCIRSRELPNADIEKGHRSACLVHLGNIAYRIGRRLTFDAAKEAFVGDLPANRLLKRTYRKPYVIPERV
jgi:predicted dehydrogenase